MKAKTLASTTATIKAATTTATKKTKKTIIYLPPFYCYTCKQQQQHVPATITPIATTNKLTSASRVIDDNAAEEQQENDSNDDVSVAVVRGGGDGGYGSCCQRCWEHKNYDKHDMTTTMMTPKATTTTTITRVTRLSGKVVEQAGDVTQVEEEESSAVENRITTNKNFKRNNSGASAGVNISNNSDSNSSSIVGVNGRCMRRNFLQQQQEPQPQQRIIKLSTTATTLDKQLSTPTPSTYSDVELREQTTSYTRLCHTPARQQQQHQHKRSVYDDVMNCYNNTIAFLNEDIAVVHDDDDDDDGNDGDDYNDDDDDEDDADDAGNEKNSIKLRQTQLVMPIVVGGFGDAATMCVVNNQQQKNPQPQQQQARSGANLPTTMTRNRHTQQRKQPRMRNNVMATPTKFQLSIKNSQTTTTAAAVKMTLREECSRCFKYNKNNNGDISACEKVNCDGGDEQQQHLEKETVTTTMAAHIQNDWLHCWQQLLMQNAITLGTAKNNKFGDINEGELVTKMTAIAAASTTTKSWLALFVMLLLTSTANCWGGRQDVQTNCTFPARWEGSWFLSGYQQSIHIKGSSFSYRGRCAASDGNKYLIVDEKGCHRCLVIYEKHKNVLQYKESECEGDSMYMHQSNPSALAIRSSSSSSTINKQSSGDHRGGAHPNSNGHSRLSSSDQYIMRSNDDMNDYFCKGRETLQNLCDQIPGDALLYSLFRESAEPVKCPLKGPFIFTYNRGHGECKSPVSNIESCTEESRLLLSFQACPDVQGTESTVEELTCLATWKDGNSRYLVGLVSHHHAISNEERYRCFVYEKVSSLMGGPSIISSKDVEYKLAQSGDATCNGLDSAEVGSRIMSLRKPPPAERCDFPVWFKGPRHWHALMGNAVYNYHSNDGSVHIIKPNGYMETRALCEQINKQTATEMMVVVHYTTGCQSGFMCMMFYRRDTHVIEIQTGKQAVRLEDACAPDHFDINKMPYITLLASNPDPQICPMEGLYNLRGAIGPPYLATRHKRNHNNKAHVGHAHHTHHESELSGNVGGSVHKRHSTLSFRNTERGERSSWHANTRGLPVRSRRNANLAADTDSAANKELLLNAAVAPVTEISTTSVGFVSRSRRDVPGCVTNYKAQRQLWVGCTAPNLIDVRPMCNVDGEEEYSCHGSWSENGTHYIIARHKSTKHGVCISYRPTEGTAAKLVIGDACYRGAQKPPDHHLVANLSVFGKCGETGSAPTRMHISNWSFIGTILMAIGTFTTLQLLSEYQMQHRATHR